MSFDRSDHLRPLDCIVWLSRRTHKTAGEDNRELCQHQDYSPHEPQCVGVAAHVGELTEDRIAQEVFQPLASSSSTIAQPTAIRVRGIACLSLRGFVQVAASEHGVGAAAFIGVPGQRPHRPRGREALTPAVCISIRARAAATLLRGNHTVIDRQQKPIVGLVSAGLCQHLVRGHVGIIDHSPCRRCAASCQRHPKPRWQLAWWVFPRGTVADCCAAPRVAAAAEAAARIRPRLFMVLVQLLATFTLSSAARMPCASFAASSFAQKCTKKVRGWSFSM